MLLHSARTIATGLLISIGFFSSNSLFALEISPKVKIFPRGWVVLKFKESESDLKAKLAKKKPYFRSLSTGKKIGLIPVKKTIDPIDAKHFLAFEPRIPLRSSHKYRLLWNGRVPSSVQKNLKTQSKSFRLPRRAPRLRWIGKGRRTWKFAGSNLVPGTLVRVEMQWCEKFPEEGDQLWEDSIAMPWSNSSSRLAVVSSPEAGGAPEFSVNPKSFFSGKVFKKKLNLRVRFQQVDFDRNLGKRSGWRFLSY